VQYGVRKDTGRIDYDEVREPREEGAPGAAVGGRTAYSRIWDFETMASIAREVGARFCADIAHIAGLIAGGRAPVAGARTPTSSRRRRTRRCADRAAA
jgi:glycine hydroxymethyltransferase